MAQKIDNLPLGFADQVMELEIRLEEQQSLEVIQILSQMYRIAVDYYIERDTKKAMYFQKKLNNLVVKSLNANSVQSKKNKQLPNKIRRQISQYQQCEKTVVKSLVQHNQRASIRIQRHVEADLNKQQQSLNSRLLRRVKSQGRLN